MNIRFYNPPPVLLARGNSKETEIGGARSIIAMDKDHNLHVVENIFSELSKAKFWDEPGLENEIENVTPVHQDDSAVYDEQVLIERITSAFEKMKKNRWIFFGIAGFESNAFVTNQFVDLTEEQRELLQEAHTRIRNQQHFPKLEEAVKKLVGELEKISTALELNFELSEMRQQPSETIHLYQVKREQTISHVILISCQVEDEKRMKQVIVQQANYLPKIRELHRIRKATWGRENLGKKWKGKENK